MNEQYSNLKSRHLYPSNGSMSSSNGPAPTSPEEVSAGAIGAAGGSSTAAAVSSSDLNALGSPEDKLPEGWGKYHSHFDE